LGEAGTAFVFPYTEFKGVTLTFGDAQQATKFAGELQALANKMAVSKALKN
jgi:hypothetical protein